MNDTEDYNELLSIVGDIVDAGHMDQEGLARLRAHLGALPVAAAGASRAEPQSGYYLWEHPKHPSRVARPEDADFAKGEPLWVRCYPVEVFDAVVGEPVAPAVTYTECEMYEMQRDGTLPDVQAWLTYCEGEPNVQPELRRRFGWCQFHTPVWMPLVFQRTAIDRASAGEAQS